MSTGSEVEHTEDTPEQAAFRAEARAFVRSHLPPRRDANPWALNFTSDESEARAHFETGRAWQRLLFDNGFAGLTYPREYGGRGGRCDRRNARASARNAACSDVSSA